MLLMSLYMHQTTNQEGIQPNALDLRIHVLWSIIIITNAFPSMSQSETYCITENIGGN